MHVLVEAEILGGLQRSPQRRELARYLAHRYHLLLHRLLLCSGPVQAPFRRVERRKEARQLGGAPAQIAIGPIVTKQRHELLKLGQRDGVPLIELGLLTRRHPVSEHGRLLMASQGRLLASRGEHLHEQSAPAPRAQPMPARCLLWRPWLVAKDGSPKVSEFLGCRCHRRQSLV